MEGTSSKVLESIQEDDNEEAEAVTTVTPTMAAAVQIQLHRQSTMQPWGFRLSGGMDYRQQLSVKKVAPGSPAHGRLNGGDAIISIGQYDAANLTHAQASNIIKSSGNSLTLAVRKGMTPAADMSHIKPSGPIKFSAGRAHQYGY